MLSNNERLERATTTLATMLDYLGLNAVVKGEERNGKIVLLTASEDAGRIIGKKGQSLHSLELLLNRMSTRDDIECPWISINVDGYSKGSFNSGRFPKKKYEPREVNVDSDKRRPARKPNRFSDEDAEKITQQALDAAKEVKRWGESVTLSPMNSHDRRLIHMSLKEDLEVTTTSVPVSDNDRMKSVVISITDK